MWDPLVMDTMNQVAFCQRGDCSKGSLTNSSCFTYLYFCLSVSDVYIPTLSGTRHSIPELNMREREMCPCLSQLNLTPQSANVAQVLQFDPPPPPPFSLSLSLSLSLFTPFKLETEYRFQLCVCLWVSEWARRGWWGLQSNWSIPDTHA